MISAMIIVAPLTLVQAGQPEVDMTTIVTAAASQTELARTVEMQANLLIEKYSYIPKEHLGTIVAIGASAAKQEISTYPLKNANFSIGEYKARLDVRYKVLDKESNVSFSLVREF